MKVVICASIEFTPKIKEVRDQLVKLGHEVSIPFTSQRIINGELTVEEFKAKKYAEGDAHYREFVMMKIKDDLIRRYYSIIKGSDAILVLNQDKNGIANYIGGNTFLEMGFAHVLQKPIYLWSDIPNQSYTDEVLAMQPLVVHGDPKKIK